MIYYIYEIMKSVSLYNLYNISKFHVPFDVYDKVTPFSLKNGTSYCEKIITNHNN